MLQAQKCLRDFKTKDHLCLFPDLLSFGFVVFKIVFMPLSVGFGLFSLFFFVFVWLSIIISVVFKRSSNLLTNRSIYLHCFIWMIMKDETLHDQFQHPSSLLCLDGKNKQTLLFCPPVWGVILVKVISKNITRLKMGLQRIYFSLVKGLSKMVFPHLKLMH